MNVYMYTTYMQCSKRPLEGIRSSRTRDKMVVNQHVVLVIELRWSPMAENVVNC